MKDNTIGRTSYVKGLLGAIIGALLGVIAWTAVAYFVGGNLHLCFGFVLSILVYYGYRLAGGKVGGGFYAVYIPVVLIFGFGAFLIGNSIMTLNSLLVGYTFGIGEFFSLVPKAIASTLQTLATSWTYLVIALIFEASGIVYYMNRIATEMERPEVQEKDLLIAEDADVDNGADKQED